MSGGTKQVVTIKKIHGDKRKLLNELSEALSLDSGSIRINPTTQHIELKVSIIPVFFCLWAVYLHPTGSC